MMAGDQFEDLAEMMYGHEVLSRFVGIVAALEELIGHNLGGRLQGTRRVRW
jgi:hypothetical protein